MSGDTSSYRNWSPVEPNNPLTTDPENPELFVHIWNPADPNAGDWNNFRDNATVFSRPVNGVVEVMAVPEPAAVGLLFLGALGSLLLSVRSGSEQSCRSQQQTSLRGPNPPGCGD